MGHGGSLSIPLVHTSSLASFPCSESLGQLRDFGLLLHYQYQTLTETPLRYFVVAQCHGDPADSVL